MQQPSTSFLSIIATTMLVSLLLFSACVQNQDQPDSATLSTPAASHSAPQLGIVFDRTMKVVDVDWGSVAEKAGIQKGDILLSVDGVAFANELERVKALIYESPGEAAYTELQESGGWQGIPRKLILERDGKQVEVEITPAPLTWWGLSPTPTAVPTELALDYL